MGHARVNPGSCQSSVRVTKGSFLLYGWVMSMQRQFQAMLGLKQNLVCCGIISKCVNSLVVLEAERVFGLFGHENGSG